MAREHRLAGVLALIHLPQSPGAGHFTSLNRRALTPFAWLRADARRAVAGLTISLRRRALAPLAWLSRLRRAAHARRPGCVAARSPSGRPPRLLPETCPGPWCGARGAGLAAGLRHDVRERAGPGLRRRRRAVAGPCEAAAGGERPCTAPAPCSARVRDTRRGLDAGGPWDFAYPTYPAESRQIPLNPAYPAESRRIPPIPLDPGESRLIPLVPFIPLNPSESRLIPLQNLCRCPAGRRGGGANGAGPERNSPTPPQESGVRGPTPVTNGRKLSCGYRAWALHSPLPLHASRA